ncbi:MAG: hypothetical protein QXM86_03295 [Candidatus Bathyarchaeia archaeon]
MTTQKPQKTLVTRWLSSKGIALTLAFLIAAFLIEYAIVLYAKSLGITENPENKIFGAISPLFHLIPTAVVIALTFNWAYLTKYLEARHQEPVKKKVTSITKREEKSKKSLVKSLQTKMLYLKQKIANATVKSALTVLLLFAVFAFIVSLLAYPRLIYEAVAGAYRNNEAFLNFIKSTTEALAPIFWLFSVVGNAFIFLAPALREFVLAIGNVISPLANLDAAGKYIAFQNAAAWISALSVLIYVKYARNGLKHRTRR